MSDVCDTRWQPADTQEGATGKTCPPTEVAASGFVGVVGCSAAKKQHPNVPGVIFDLGPAVESPWPVTASCTSNIGKSVGLGSAGDTEAAAAAPSTAARKKGNPPLLQAGAGLTPLPLLLSMPSARPSSTSHGPAEAGGNGNGKRGEELPHASEVEGMDASGLLDEVDALLGEELLEGFEESYSEEGMLPLFKGTPNTHV